MGPLLNEKHPTVLLRKKSLSACLVKTGKVDEGLELLHELLPVVLQVRGPRHLKAAQIYLELGLAYEGKGSFRDAAENLQKCIEIREHNYGKINELVGKCYLMLGRCLDKAGQAQVAMEHLEHAIDVLEQVKQSKSYVGNLEANPLHKNLSDTKALLAEIRGR